ncbi:MAG: decarboxylase [Lachnospiraceae bacterium]|nr:decarboxylase [Lachnospiraceae bacterium]
MDNNLREALIGYLDTLKKNLAIVSLEELKTKYKKPFGELQHNISTTATAYIKEVTLKDLRIREDLLAEAQPIIQSTIDKSGILRQISSAAFKNQDIEEIDRLALSLKEQIRQALAPFYKKHLCVYLEKECFDDTPKSPELYNQATGCVWRNGAWTPTKIDKTAILLPIQDIPTAA